MKKIRDVQSGLIKGILMWVPMGLVVVGLLGYVLYEFPQRYSNAMQSIAEPSYVTAAAGEAPADIKAARVAGSSRNNGNNQPGNPGNPPNANDNSTSAQATSSPSVRGRNTSALANEGVAEPMPVFDLEMMGMVNELKSIDSSSAKAALLRGQILDRLVAEFSENQESQRKDLARLKKVIAEWESNLLLREKMRREIVESQLASRLGIPNPLQWDYEGKNMLAPSLPLEVLSTSKTLMDAYWEHAAKEPAVLAEVSESEAAKVQSEGTPAAEADKKVEGEPKDSEPSTSKGEELKVVEEPKLEPEAVRDGAANPAPPAPPTEEPKSKEGSSSDGSGDAQ